MSNTSRVYRYTTRASDGSTVRQIFVRADTSANTLVLSGQTNSEPAAIIGSGVLQVLIEGRGGPKAKLSHARTVTIVMTAAGAGLSVGSRVVVPVFQFSRWAAYDVNQTGTYATVACRCVDKRDGSPNLSGRGF